MGTLTQSPWSGAGTSMSGLVAKVWSGHDTLSRSPKDSPPIEKKRLRRLNTTWLYRQRAPLASLDDSYINSADATDAKSLSAYSDNKSAIRARSNSVPRPIIKSAPAKSSARSRHASSSRKVTFRPQITVEYMDDEKHLKTEHEDLNSEPRDRQKFMTRNLTRINQQLQQQRSAASYIMNYDQTDSSSSLEAPIAVSGQFIMDDEHSLLVYWQCRSSDFILIHVLVHLCRR